MKGMDIVSALYTSAFGFLLFLLSASNGLARELGYVVCEVVKEGFTSPVEGKVYVEVYPRDAGAMESCRSKCKGEKNGVTYKYGFNTLCKRTPGAPPKFGDNNYPKGKAVGYRCNLEPRLQAGLDCPNDLKTFHCDTEKYSDCDARPALAQCEAECDCGDLQSKGGCEKVSYGELLESCEMELKEFENMQRKHQEIRAKYRLAESSYEAAKKNYGITCGIPDFPPGLQPEGYGMFCAAEHQTTVIPALQRMTKLKEQLESATTSLNSARSAYENCFRAIR